MQRFNEASETKEKYKDELMRLGASSVHVNLRKQPNHGKTYNYRLIIIIKVPDHDRKAAIENFLAKQKHPGRLDRFQTEIIIIKKKPKHPRIDLP